MATLNERLARIKESFLKKAPPEAVAVMNRATQDLRDADILARGPQVGDVLPEFDLEDTAGGRVRSADLLGRGPLVLTFYRGVW